jgi:hypothetical protein
MKITFIENGRIIDMDLSDESLDVIHTSLCLYLDQCHEAGLRIEEDERMQKAANWLKFFNFKPDPSWRFASYCYNN